jgi:hypothetical protein
MLSLAAEKEKQLSVTWKSATTDSRLSLNENQQCKGKSER